MRLARALLFLALSGAVAHADDAKPADASADAHEAKPAEAHTKVPLRVVRMLPETRQALLFDKTKGTHVVVEAGQAVEGFVVDSLDADEVTLLSDSGATVVLAAPEPAWRHRRNDGHPTEGGNGREWRDARAPDGRTADRTTTVRTTSAAKPGEPQPADPYADVAEPSTIGTGADGVRVVEAPDATAVGAAPASATVYGAAPASAPVVGAAPSSATVVGAAPTSAPVYGAAPSTIGTGADGVRVVEAPNAAAAASPAPAPAPAPVAATAPTAATVPATAAATVPATATATAAVAVPATAAATVPATAAATVPASATAAVAATAAAPATAAVAAPATAAATVAAPATAAAPATISDSADPTGDALAAALTGAPAAPATATAATAPAAPAAASDGPIVLPRGDVRAALGNFGTLAGSIHGAFTATGVRVDSVTSGSLFAKAGLRGGDVIASVDGKALRSLDDAADLYARAASARNVSVAIVRAGKPVTLRVAIQ